MGPLGLTAALHWLTVVTMLISKTELAARYGLSERQVRHRLTALDTLLTGHVNQGQGGQTVLDDYAVAIFDRLRQLEREGLSPSAAASRIRQDDLPHVNDSGSSAQRQGSVNGGQGASAEVLEQLRARLADRDDQLRDLRIERDRLLGVIEDQGVQLRALAPGVSVKDRGDLRFNRWWALRYVIFGH